VLTSGVKTARWIVTASTTAYQKLVIGIFDERKESVDLLASVAKMLGFTCFFDEFAANRDKIIAVFPKQAPEFAYGSSGFGCNIAMSESWYVEVVLMHQTQEIHMMVANGPTFKEAAVVVAQISDIINAGTTAATIEQS
jgi:hypothetical protein